MNKFIVQDLPDIDAQHLRRALCPWCLKPITPGGIEPKDSGDRCYDCGDEFITEKPTWPRRQMIY